jgi:hypothetical protein
MSATQSTGRPIAAPAPIIGDWYRYSGGELFEVVACDDDEGTIEIQHFDGTVEELDFDDWNTGWLDHEIETAAAPEDWSGSVDMDTEDDAGTSLRDAR